MSDSEYFGMGSFRSVCDKIALIKPYWLTGREITSYSNICQLSLIIVNEFHSVGQLKIKTEASPDGEITEEGKTW